MKPLLFNPTDGKYEVEFIDNRVNIRDCLGEKVEPTVALEIARQIADQYHEACYVYVGRRDDWIKIGMSGNLERRDKELQIDRALEKRCGGREEAQRLEKAILDFLSRIKRPVYQVEWFQYCYHDLELLKNVFALCNAPLATEMFKYMTVSYTKIRHGIAHGKRSQALDFIYRWNVPAFCEHAKIEFGYLPGNIAASYNY
jgi:hypothetical protein